MKKTQESGFTLVEMVVTLAVAGIILPMLGSFFFQTIYFPLQRSAELTAYKDLNNTMVWLSRDVSKGPTGNNLSPSATRPPYASVSIGSSPGYPGNNSMTMVYNTWTEPGSTSTTRNTITWALEDLGLAAGDIQLVRTDENGQKQVMAFHIADPTHVAFSGSTVSSQAGGVSPGLELTITSTVQGGRGPVSRTAVRAFALPRTYQPPLTPSPPAPATWDVILPNPLPSNSGYWQVITTAASGNISAEWRINGAASLQLYVYNGQPMGAPSGDSAVTCSKVNATVVASNSAITNDLVATSVGSQAAGIYTVYFFNRSNDYVNTASATVTYVSPGGELGQ